VVVVLAVVDVEDEVLEVDEVVGAAEVAVEPVETGVVVVVELLVVDAAGTLSTVNAA
jgi:hypothetical protein